MDNMMTQFQLTVEQKMIRDLILLCVSCSEINENE